MSENPTANTVWIPMYLGDCKVNFTVNLDTPLTEVQVQVALAAHAALIAAGFTAREVGLGDGEQSEIVHFAARRVKNNKDGTQTPVVDLYVDKLKFRFMGVYLNTPDEIAAFESASGLRLDSLPLYLSAAPLKRGDFPELDAAHLRQLPTPAKVIFTVNPNATEENKEAKRRFVRWSGGAVAAPIVDVSVGKLNLAPATTRRVRDMKAIERETVQHFKDPTGVHFHNTYNQLEARGAITDAMTDAQVITAINADRLAQGKTDKGWWNDAKKVKALDKACQDKYNAPLWNILPSMGAKMGDYESDVALWKAIETQAAVDAQFAALGSK